MAAVAMLHPGRNEAALLLKGDKLGNKFHQLFDTVDENNRKKEKKKPKKKGKSKGKEKSKSKREKSPEKSELQPPGIELHGNPSSFVVYSNVRQAVLEHQIKQMSQIFLLANSSRLSDSESEDEGEEKTKDAILKLPKIIGLGLCGVFEIIKETRTTHPGLCTRALKALLDMLQGQQPEGLKNEPADVIDSLYQLLMELAITPTSLSRGESESEGLTAVACSCLLSLVVARGDTGKMLAAVSSMLMSPSILATQEMKVPSILISLQKSVQAVLLGKTQHPDWLSQGVREKACLNTIVINDLPQDADAVPGAMASDGSYLYIHNSQGLHKVGSGYGGTIKGHLYASNNKFCLQEQGWLAYVQNHLFYRPSRDTNGILTMINIETLQPGDNYKIEGKGYGTNVMFSDGENLGHVAAARDDTFVVRTFSPICSPMPLVSELPLKLARKCLDVFGLASYDGQAEMHSLSTGFDEDPIGIAAGRDFAVIRTPTGKIYYTGRSATLGIKQGGPKFGKWAELPIIKSPKIVQMSVGHEGQHGLLVAEDGSVFFVGTPKRGEDGDASMSKARRQPKPVKPKKMIKLEGKHVVMTACNNGTSAVITRDGDLFMFGKDTIHCDHGTGQVTDLKELSLVSVALGKAHAAVLTNKGHVYTFGINNKGQCGRDYLAGAARELSMPVTMADEEEDGDEEFMCPPGKHKWKHELCMVCTSCGECSGYGNSCISSGRPGRHPGMLCGCGSGDSGCTECGVCRSCAGEVEEEKGAGGEGANGGGLIMEVLARQKDALPLDLIIGRQGARNLDQLNRRLEEKRHKAKVKMRHSNKAKAAASSEPISNNDYEQDHVKMSSLPPARVEFGNSEMTAKQVVCGLQHTVVLLENGDVYTFGSNQYGQLGQGDTSIRGSPARVHLKFAVDLVTAGGSHTVLLTTNGQVYTFGHYAKGQLGRPAPEDEDQIKDKKAPWFAVPGLVPGIGAKHGRRATWVGASGDQTFLRIDESLINAHTLSKSNIVANQSCIGLIPTVKSGGNNIKCLMISKSDGSCRSFCGPEQADLAGLSVCLDPVYDVLWSYCSSHQEIGCYNVLQSESRCLQTVQENYCDILGTELVMPVRPNTLSTRSHGALHMLGCLDTLTTAQHLGMTVFEEEKEKQTTAKVYTKEDYSVVNRFESHGGGWGYSGHSIEAVRFMVDTDLLLGGFGLFGGRGEYFGKIKVFDLGPDGGDNETDGELMAESEEIPYECGAREKYPILFDDPLLLTANHWYVAWSRISGPSSDCGSSGHSTVTTEDQVVMKFKSSKKSNNGTDVNAGQIPQILYRLPTHDSGSSNRKNEQTEPAHVLTKEFSRAVTPECFDSLLRLLNWSWNAFCAVVGEVQLLKGVSFTAALLDLERLVYISTASLRLICTYICELYPDQGINKKTPAETSRLAECVGETRSLLRKILGESRRHLAINQKGSLSKASTLFEKMGEKILKECHHTFTSCFHALYPTGSLKWTCLCELLDRVDPHHNNVEGWGRLLAAVMEALCHPTVKLTNLMPINCEHGTEQILKKQYGTDDNTNSAALSGDISQFPLLVSHMIQRTEMEGSSIGHWSFREVLDKLLTIVVLPVRQALSQEKVHLPSLLISNTCSLLAAVISELAASATGTETELTGSSRPLRVSPSRFMRTTQNPHWNTGDGNPEAICFSVDKSGILIAGVCVYGGVGQYEYELELLSEQCDNSADQLDSGRWTTLEMVKGSFSGDDCVNDIAEIKFDRPFAVKEGVIYALRLRNRGPKSYNGEGGVPKVKCPDSSIFSFCACSLSSNGTNHTRGQIPQLLYYSAPQDGENHIQNSKALAEYQARKNAISITSTIFRAATDLLHRAQGITDDSFAKVIGSANIFSTLLPMGVAYIGPVASMDPRGAVQVLGLVQEILPPISEINSQLGNQVVLPSPTALLAASQGETNGTFLNGLWEGATTSQHYAVVESDHPYKPATVANYKVTFPEQVKWMVLEFDSQCGTAQVEDTLQLYIPACRAARGFSWTQLPGGQSEDTDHQAWWPVLKKFHGTSHWPSTALVLAGNKVCFSLETASDYVKDDKACFYGFKCAVVGYEWSSKPEEGLVQLEKEITSLGGMCATSLMRKDLQLPPTSVDEMDEDLDYIDEGAQQIFQAHPSLLSKGFALSQPPTINRALDGNLPFSWSSNERAFLKDFVACTAGTSGGRLAAWMQPESYLDAKNCDILYSKEELKCSWPAVITIQTKDQYEQLVNVPNLKVEAKAVPVVKDTSNDERRAKRLSRYDSESVLTFGGHPPPKLDTPYQVTIKDKKDAYHAICMMKPYESYSFEELRYAAPAVRRPSENMLVRANNDGTYSANWTPGGVGWYRLHITLDGYEIGEVFKVEVKEPPQGVTPPSQNTPKKPGHQPNKMRKFVAQYSAGLRIRVNPSLQSEQVGVIKPNGIICFIDEIHNDDGVWLRLSPDSIREWCNPINGYMEAWALQYNQHLGKVLLVPVEEPKSILDEMIKETIMRRLPELVRDSTQPVQGGPGLYHVVKCGSSGHNIRCRPHMKATPIGMVVLGDTVTVMDDMTNHEGVWVKLDDESKKRYCHEVEGEAWSLARGVDDIFYIQHEANLSAEAEETIEAFNAVSNVPAKGFDFTTAQQTPSFSAFGLAGSMPTFGAGFSTDPSISNTSGVAGTTDKNPTGLSTESTSCSSGPMWPTFGISSPSGTVEPDKVKSPVTGTGKREEYVAGSHSPKSPHPTSPLVAGAVGGAVPRPPERKDSLVKDITASIPPELQGVSVKDLVKALGKVKLEKELNKALKSQQKTVGRTLIKQRINLETDLKGVSVKDVIRLLGESRVNGNGVTPPRTPPGTPKKNPSRGSSPKPAGSPHPEHSPRGGTSPLIPSSPQPKHRETSGLAMPVAGSPSHSPSRTPPCTPPRTPPTHRRQGSGSLGTPPPTPPSVRRDLSPAIGSPRLSTPAMSSPCRSSSSSPQRSGSPISLPRPSSASPSRGGHSASGNHPPEAIKGHFSIGASSPKEDVRMSPKTCRKDRSRTLRTKRERAASPAPKEKGHTRSRSGSSQVERAREQVKEALSPSVAQCMRAVFAAFMWHEGIVHDAMACASFLKFHPNLPKELHKMKADKDSGSESSKSTPSGTLKKQAKKDPTNININEAVKKIEITRSKERTYSESRASEMEDKDLRELTPPKGGEPLGGAGMSESQLPPTLKHLVFFWEELATATLKVIMQNLILPSPATQVKSKKYDKKDKEKDKDKKIKKKKDGKYGGGRRGNLFGEAGEGEWDIPMFGGIGGREAGMRDPGAGAPVAGAAAAAAGDRETMCELCGGKFPHPVTYHMRKAHPGCGKHAGGQGYNSGGNFCGGWAGNCGDGGVGGSTWYLLCDICRDRYLKEKRQVMKDKIKKTKKKSSQVKQASVSQVLEAHLVMKNNAMFLLDLASSMGMSLPSGATPKTGPALRLQTALPSVSEDSSPDQCPFSPVPFLYLIQRGAQAADTAFAEEMIFSDTEDVPVPQGLSKSGHFERSVSHVETRMSRSGSVGTDRQKELSTIPPDKAHHPDKKHGATVSPCETERAPSPGKSVLFQRSISENAGQIDSKELTADTNAENTNRTPVVRRRNNSGGLADGGVSLLKHPSHSMARLIQSAEKISSKQGVSDKVLQRDVMSFVIQRHDLDSLQLAMKQAVRKAACRVFALQAFNWLVRSVTQPSCLHDLLWYFVGSLTPPPPDMEEDEADGEAKKDKREQDQEKEVVMCEHPLSDITIAGEAVRPLLETFHTFLQTISDVMMYLPPGSALQQMAVRCWCLKFKPSDHMFLHKSHVFSNISKILSKSDEGWGINSNGGEPNQEVPQVECLKDLTGMAEIKASSRQAMIVSLTDNSTETFWESGDDDRNRTKTVTITCLANHSPRMVYVHVDNSRDLANKVSSIVFNAGHTAEDLKKLKQVELEPRHSGWVSSSVPEPHMCVVKLEVKGPDNSLRLRQVKALGDIDGSNLVISKPLSPLVVQQKNCEAETLKVFRLLTSQVFGKLISDEASNMDSNRENNAMPSPGDLLPVGDVDLKEHMVSILFSRSKLTHLQKQVCAHIVQAIRKETIRVQEEWEDSLQSGQSHSHEEKARGSDAYCFELLSMVLALSGSAVGRVYLAEQHNLLQDLLSLLHTSSPRVQRQVTALLRRVLPEVQPQTLASLLGVTALPPADFSILSNAKNPHGSGGYDPASLGVLDVFLACIAKALTVQVKVKGQGVKGTTTSFRLADCIPSTSVLAKRWWMRGTTSTKLSETIIALLKDLASGQLSDSWATVTKGAIAEAILALTKVEESTRVSTECVKTPTLWLALSSLCVLDQEHVERLSSGQWVSGGEQSQPRPTCSNHDDGETLAIILCNECGNLCADCDRFLHLHRRTRSHQRQVFKEEEEAIKVDLHEGCGRTKLFWVMALADSKTLKAMVEFREGTKGKLSNGGGPSTGTCRFCGTSSSTGILAVGNVCSHPDCQEHAKNCCTRSLPCGHACGGFRDEETCLPCLHGCSGDAQEKLKQDADDMCMVCFTEAISAAPALQLGCGHVFHQHCCRSVLSKKWVGPRITFGFSLCPICKAPIEHKTLRDLLEPLHSLYEDVHRKALMRLEYEGLHKAEAIANPGTRFYHDPASYAMDRYAYYVCFKCGKAYYGGEARCEEQAAVVDEYDPSELVCGACSDVSRAQMCPKHGTDFLEYKCRYCCSVAVFFCFGTTHFCNACHDDFQRVTNIPKNELPHCPCGPKAKQLAGDECPLHVQHPHTGEEFALGCGVCRNAHTF